MKILIFLLYIIIFLKTTSYGIHELKENNNKAGGITVIAIATISLIFPNAVIYFRGI